MTGFIVICALLVLFSGVFYLVPRRRADDADEDLQQANLAWFRLREQELNEEGSDELEADTRLRLLEDEQSAAPAAASASSSQFPAWALLVAVALFSGLLYIRLGAMPDVMIASKLESLDENTSPEQMQALMHDIEARSASRPENLHYVAMLGRYYMGQQDYTRAAQVYSDLSVAAPQDAQALANAAQASYLAAGRQLDDRARMQAEQALAINPHQRTALGLLGMASYEQGMYRAAIEYWERLIAMEPPGSETANMVGSIINMARAKLGEAPAAEGATAVAATPAGAGVTVAVAMPEGATVAPGDTVFVLARNAESDSRMPIAVQRLSGSQLPLTLRLDDSNSMAGQKLSETASVLVLVQVSPSGQPGEANASWLGQAGPLAPSADSEPVEIILRPAS